jgi:hypothetical protein
MLGVGAAAAAGKHLVDDEPQYKAQLIYGPAITELAPLKREGESVVYDPPELKLYGPGPVDRPLHPDTAFARISHEV